MCVRTSFINIHALPWKASDFVHDVFFLKGPFKNDVTAKIRIFGTLSPLWHHLSVFSSVKIV